MFDLKRIKILINPLNAIITGVIILFVFSRVLSNNYENAFVVEEITKVVSHTEQQLEQQTEKQPEQQSEQQSEEQTEQQTEQHAEQQLEQQPKQQTSSNNDAQSYEYTDNSAYPTNSNASTASIIEPLAYSAELDQTFTLDAFNNLSKDELMTFTGIGEVTAQAILDYRRDNGPFSEFEDLMLVKGIGEKKLQKIMTILP